MNSILSMKNKPEKFAFRKKEMTEADQVKVKLEITDS